MSALAIRSRQKMTIRGRRARVHVAATINVVVDLGRTPQHAGIEKDGKGRCFQCTALVQAALVRSPQHLEQQRGNHGIDVHAIDIAGHT